MTQTDQIEALPVRVSLNKDSYDKSCAQYEQATDRKLFGSDTIIIGGYGASMKVEHRAMVLRSKRVTAEEKITKLYRGTHSIQQVIILSDGGYITIEAIKWCIDQDITVILLDWKGSLIQVLTPKHPSSAKLISQQYMASQSDLRITIAQELIRMKTTSQIEMIRSKTTILRFIHSSQYISSIIQLLEDGLSELPHKKTIETIRLHEAILASFYWQVFIGYPVKWDKSMAKIISPHWLSITKRGSTLSQNAKYAINPFHAALNFAYALLEAQCLKAITIEGLDPNTGYLHQTDHNALVFDLMEPLRATVDEKVFDFFRTTTFHRGDFYQVLSGECRMNEELRRYILATCRAEQEDIEDVVRWLKEVIVRGG